MARLPSAKTTKATRLPARVTVCTSEAIPGSKKGAHTMVHRNLLDEWLSAISFIRIRALLLVVAFEFCRLLLPDKAESVIKKACNVGKRSKARIHSQVAVVFSMAASTTSLSHCNRADAYFNARPLCFTAVKHTSCQGSPPTHPLGPLAESPCRLAAVQRHAVALVRIGPRPQEPCAARLGPGEGLS